MRFLRTRKPPKWHVALMRSLSEADKTIIYAFLTHLSLGEQANTIDLTPREQAAIERYCDTCLEHTPIHEEKERENIEIIKLAVRTRCARAVH